MKRDKKSKSIVARGYHKIKTNSLNRVNVILANNSDNDVILPQTKQFSSNVVYYTLWDYDGYIYAFIDTSNFPNTRYITVRFQRSSTTRYINGEQYNSSKYPQFYSLNSINHAVDSQWNSVSSFRLSSGTWTFSIWAYDNNKNEVFHTNDNTYVIQNTLSTPSITGFNTNTNVLTVNAGSNSSNRCYLQIEKKTRPSTVNGFTIKQRDYFYTAGMKGIEGGKYWEGIPSTYFEQDIKAYIRKWNYPYITAKVVFDNAYKLSASGTTRYANISTSTKNTCFGYVQEAINAINNMNTGFTIQLDNTYETMPDNIVMIRGDIIGNEEKLVENYNNVNPYYDLIIRIGIKDSMYSPDQYYNGNWGIWGWGNHPEWGLSVSIANIASDITVAVDGETVKHVVFEEILQSLGAGNDSWSEPDSVYFDPPYTNPESYNELDSSVFKQLMLCQSGWDAFDCINNLDTPCLLYKNASTSCQFDLSKLNAGTYIATAWIVNEDDDYSLKTAEYEFTITSLKPNAWHWSQVGYTLASGGEIYDSVYQYINGAWEWTAYVIPANEWNQLTERINQFRVYYGLLEAKGILVGSEFNPYFKVDEDTGKVTMNDATITGNFTMTGGSISWANINTEPIDNAQSTANNAYSLANSAYSRAGTALSNIDRLANGTFTGYTFINGTTISSPTVRGGYIVGGKFFAVDNPNVNIVNNDIPNVKRLIIDNNGIISKNASNGVSGIKIDSNTWGKIEYYVNDGYRGTVGIITDESITDIYIRSNYSLVFKSNYGQSTSGYYKIKMENQIVSFANSEVDFTNANVKNLNITLRFA